MQLSADDIPILFHDLDLVRTVCRPGLLLDHSASELCVMDAGAWHSVPFAGARVPLYEDIVTYCRANKIWMNVEVKGNYLDMKHFRKISHTVALLTKHLYADELSQVPINYHNIPIFSSFSPEALEETLVAAPEIPRALLVRGIGPKKGFVESIDELLLILGRLEATACHLNEVGLTADNVAALLGAGFSVMCYTVNCPQRVLELEQYGVHAMCTDRFDLDADGVSKVQMSRL